MPPSHRRPPSAAEAHPSTLPSPAPTVPLVLALLALAGCSSPFAALPEDYGQRVPRERLRQIERLGEERFARASEEPRAEEIVDAVQGRQGRFVEAEKLEFTIEKARAAALERNADLKVALVDPTIASESLRAEEAKFEAVFTPSVRARNFDEPALDLTNVNTQSEDVSVSAGVSVPLRTGGRATVGLSESRSESNNPFVTLNRSFGTGLDFSISQPLLRNAGRRATTYSIRIAAYDEQIAQARTKLEVIRQLAAVDRSYWRLYAARRELEVRQRQLELAQAQLQKAQRRVAAGDLPEVEALRAESGVAERLGTIIAAENDVLATQRDLKRVMNVPGVEMETRTAIVPGTEPDPVLYRFDAVRLADYAVGETGPGGPLTDAQGRPAPGRGGRMEMLEEELRLAQDASTIEFNRNQALPLITLDYTYRISGLGGTLRESNDQFKDNNFESWTFGLSGEIPIGNEAANARVQRAVLTRLQRLSTREARRLSIRQEVLNAVDQVDAAWQRIMAARQSTVAEARTYRAEQRQYDLGARTSTEVLDAAARLAEAQSSEIRAVTDYQIALVDLAFATGTLLGASRVEWQPADPRDTPERRDRMEEVERQRRSAEPHGR